MLHEPIKQRDDIFPLEESHSTRRNVAGTANRLIQNIVALRRVKVELKNTLSTHDDCSEYVQYLEILEEQLLESYDLQHAGGGEQITVAVVGDFSSGKSTFINALLGTELCPVNIEPTTSAITYFSYGGKFAIELEQEDGTREEITQQQYQQLSCETITTHTRPYTFYITTPHTDLRYIRLVDTPGFNNPRNEYDTEITENAVRSADAFFVVTDITKGNLSGPLLNQIRKILGEADEHTPTPPALLLINQADKQPSRVARTKVLDTCKRKYAKLFKQFLLVSSKELAQVEDHTVCELVGNHLALVKDCILRRKEFKVVLSGTFPTNDSTQEITIDIDGHIKILPPIMCDDFATRADLLKSSSDILAEGRKLLSQRNKRDEEKLIQNWNKTLSSLIAFLLSAREEAEKIAYAGAPPNHLETSSNSTESRDKAVNQYDTKNSPAEIMVNNLSNLIRLAEILHKEKTP